MVTLPVLRAWSCASLRSGVRHSAGTRQFGAIRCGPTGIFVKATSRRGDAHASRPFAIVIDAFCCFALLQRFQGPGMHQSNFLKNLNHGKTTIWSALESCPTLIALTLALMAAIGSYFHASEPVLDKLAWVMAAGTAIEIELSAGAIGEKPDK
jgi:hypothetical protein